MPLTIPNMDRAANIPAKVPVDLSALLGLDALDLDAGESWEKKGDSSSHADADSSAPMPMVPDGAPASSSSAPPPPPPLATPSSAAAANATTDTSSSSSGSGSSSSSSIGNSVTAGSALGSAWAEHVRLMAEQVRVRVSVLG